MGRHERVDRMVSTRGLAIGIGLILFSGNAVASAPPRRAAGYSRKPARATAKDGKIDLRDRIRTVKKGSSSKTSRRVSERILAKVRMTRRQRQRVNSILKDTSFFRELPTLRFEVDPRAYFFLSEQPDVTVALWRAMGISKFHIRRKTEDIYTADGGDGTKGVIEAVRRHPNHNVILCSGTFKSPFLLRGVKTDSVLHVQTLFSRDKSGQTFATHRAFIHVAFPSVTMDAAAKMLSPVGNVVLDRNFTEISLFLHVMSLGMSRQPGWVESIAGRMKGVSKKQKTGLLRVTAKVYYTKRSRETIPLFKTREEYLRELMRPLRTAKRSTGESGSRSDGTIRRTGRAMK